MDGLLTTATAVAENLSFERFRQEVLKDYRIAYESREVSLLGRKEVLTGKAKFGIFGDGKEVPQVAMAKFFRPGDYYAGYYRDQTLAFATGVASLEEFFSQLYADPDLHHDPHSGGRQMNSHFATPFIDASGDFVDLVNRKNFTAGLAPTAAQMPRALGLAFASKLFRHQNGLHQFPQWSDRGNEVCFCTIGDASTSEGHFWEAVNAAGVLQIPLAIFVWDDGYGISVPTKYQTTKGSISEALKGFQKKEGTNGLDIYKIKAWDYAGMCELFEAAIQKIRLTHVPAIFHVEEVTQPQGHSTSGSHERYKSPERLQWERQWDGIRKMRAWILENHLSDPEELENLETACKEKVREAKNQAWEKYEAPILGQVHKTLALLDGQLLREGPDADGLRHVRETLASNREPTRRDVMHALHHVLVHSKAFDPLDEARQFYLELQAENHAFFNTHLYHEGARNLLQLTEVAPQYEADAPLINGYEVLNRYFDALFEHNPKIVAFGEDVGQIGDVNQGFAGLQAKYGELRIFDTGIREQTIIGQGIGLAMRGLRPIAEIQYLDYMLYCIQTLSDDLASLQYRTAGRQTAPLIVRSRGHRLEGIWHSGSPLGMILGALRGMYVCVPRNMVQAAGMYNTLLEGVDPALVIESLNGYRLKEKLPENLLEMRVPLGVPEVLQEGEDITLVSYGSTLRIVAEAAQVLATLGIQAEIIDVQTLLPFDLHHRILESLQKTNRIAFIDEDVPGGAAAFMFNQVMEVQNGYRWLDVAPRTITAKAHRPAYASDGDYFSKPNADQIVSVVLEMMAE